MSLEALRKRLASLPRDRDTVVYCGGPHGVLAVEAIEWLGENGFHARRLELRVRVCRGIGIYHLTWLPPLPSLTPP